MRLQMQSMAILRLLGANSRPPDTSLLYSRRQTRDPCILRPSREALTMMTADLPRLRATTTSTQSTITAATTTATPTTTPVPLPAMDRNTVSLAWNDLEKLLGSVLPLPADTAENERFAAVAIKTPLAENVRTALA